MQSAKTGSSIVHRCEKCGTVITVALGGRHGNAE
jgi:ribosomal protein S27E